VEHIEPVRIPKRVSAYWRFGLATLGTAGIGLALAAMPRPLHAQAAEDRQALEKRVQQLADNLSEVQKELSAVQAELTARDAAALRNATIQATASSVGNSQPQAIPQPIANTPKAVPVPPATQPGSTSESVGSVNPAAVANQTVGATQPTSAEQLHHRFFERKPGRDLTFYTKTGEITFYGNLDVSVETATKGGHAIPIGSAGAPPVGNMGWLEDVSTNLSYVGVRGTQLTGLKDTNFLFQLETSVNISTAPGLHESNSQEQDTVDGTLFTRNSYIGLGRVKWGALLFGKTDPPYKQSTARMNPFAGMEGDYGVIMGNTGGDNRVEFGYRLDHSIWLSSANLKGFQWNVLFSPGQDRAGDSDNIPAGEPDCNGGDNPGDGGLSPIACNDGSFSDVWSASVSYTHEPLYVTAAYERHMKVNRQSDITGIYSSASP